MTNKNASLSIKTGFICKTLFSQIPLGIFDLKHSVKLSYKKTPVTLNISSIRNIEKITHFIYN